MKRIRRTHTSSPKRRRAWLVLAAFAGVIGCGWIWKEFKHEQATSGYLRAVHVRDSLRTVNNRLMKDLMNYADYARIERLARERLGMVQSDQAELEMVVKGRDIPRAIGTAALIPSRMRK